MNAIEMKHVGKSYKTFAIQDMNLILPRGCIMGLIGENGAGKSTTIQLIMNAIQADAGAIRVLDVDNTTPEFHKMKEKIGVVLDEAYFPETMNANSVSKMMRYSYSNWEQEEFDSYVERFKLPEKQPFKEYSRGMKMKLAIATALAHNPELLILDEATGGLDPFVRDEILDIFSEFTRDEKHSILMSSHIVSDLEKICDYISFIHNGKLLLSEEKDFMLEEYVIAKCAKDAFTSIPQEAILGKKELPYSIEALVKRSQLTNTSGLQIERASIEDIILLLVRGVA